MNLPDYFRLPKVGTHHSAKSGIKKKLLRLLEKTKFNVCPSAHQYWLSNLLIQKKEIGKLVI
jgi:hypothetical protein